MQVKSEKFFSVNIIEQIQENLSYRKEVATGLHSQVVIMNLRAGEEIGEEVHSVDQIFFFVEGDGQAIVQGAAFDVTDGQLVFVSAGTRHNIKNIGQRCLKLLTIYAPAQHAPGTEEKIKS